MIDARRLSLALRHDELTEFAFLDERGRFGPVVLGPPGSKIP
jgi:hypothetical protein